MYGRSTAPWVNQGADGTCRWPAVKATVLLILPIFSQNPDPKEGECSLVGGPGTAPAHFIVSQWNNSTVPFAASFPSAGPSKEHSFH